MVTTEIQETIEKLPDPLKEEVLDYIQFLIQKHGLMDGKVGNLSFNWEGSLSGLKKKTTSVELQHKALEWR